MDLCIRPICFQKPFASARKKLYNIPDGYFFAN